MALIPLSLSTLGNIINEQKSTTEADVNSVPNVVLADIMAGVPAKTALGSMAVNKEWHSVVIDPFFRRQHFSRSKDCPLFIFDHTLFDLSASPIIMHLLEGESTFDLDPHTGNRRLNSRIEMCKGVRPPRFPTNGAYMRVNGKATSCEGIICSAPRHIDGRDHVNICNPVTCEYAVINFAECAIDNDQDTLSVFIGLGFSRMDKKFKLLRVSRNRFTSSAPVTWWPELFVIGTNEGWQRAEWPADSMVNFMTKVLDVIYVDGVIYWSYLNTPLICYFDFNFGMLTDLELPMRNMNMNMGVLGGYLCVSKFWHPDFNVYVWRLEKNDEGRKVWTGIFNIDASDTLVDHVGYLWTGGCYRVIKYLESGKVLLYCWRNIFLIYDPDTNTSTKFCALENSYFSGVHRTCSSYQVVAHVPCIVSLRERLNIEDANFAVVKEYQRAMNSSEATGRNGQT